jgi:exopolyphosphatase/guanosine-5'-triphosphate,3'-diphosphate pyrophosphatase
MKVAALDLGSNTFLCLICEVERTGEHLTEQFKITNTYADQVEVVRLGQGLSISKKFHPDALVRARDCLSKFKTLIAEHKPERILAMATSAARDAENKNELFQICADLEIPIEIIPGEKEADITYRGATSGQTSNSNRLIIDIGGGSTEFIFGQGLQINFARSFDIGCVRLTEKFITQQPTPNVQIENCRSFIKDTIVALPKIQIENILAVAGTPTTLAAVEIGKFSVDLIDGYQMSLESLEKWLHRLSGLTIQEKIDLGFPAGRADVILVGVLILIETLKKVNLSKIVVSTRGVRHGVALELASRS